MSIFDPRQTGSGAEPDADREREDAPLPTRFGRHGRRRPRPLPKSGADRVPGEPRAAPDDEHPFEDDGGL
jgi:hypothetical protein